MLTVIYNLINRILTIRNRRLVLKSAVFRGKAQILRRAHIRLLCDSVPDDIEIGDNFRFFGGSITSQNHGKIKIGKNVKLGFDIRIGAVQSIEIGDGSILADSITIMDNNNHPVNPLDRALVYQTAWDSEYRRWKYSESKPVVIGRNVWIGSGVRICKGVTIGDGAVVAACAVVTKDVPVNSIAAGNPARIVKTDIDKLPRLIPDNILCK